METIQVQKLDRTKRTIRPEELDTFRQALRGRTVLTSGGPAYDEARRIYNGMIDKYPAFIVRCTNVADVISSVNFARVNELLLAILGGGHSGPGLGLCDGGLVIDLSPMKGIRVDSASATAVVEAGCTWGDVDHATHAFGLATVSGIHSNTGVAGLTLGGGHGYLSRKYGLTIDNLLEADVVLADGTFVTANAENYKDLFWALRGGGGNFGVVTAFKFRLHPVDTVIGGPTLWPVEQTAEVLRWYRDFLPNAPEDLYGFFTFLVVPPAPGFPEALHGRSMCGIIWCYTGPKENAEEVFVPALRVGHPALHRAEEMPYPAMQCALDQMVPPGLQWYWKGDFIRELSNEAIALHVKYGSSLPTPLSSMHLYPIDGAVCRVGSKETAWAYRDVTWSSVTAGIDPDPANNEKIIKWAKDYWKAVHPHSAGGAYLNFIMEEGEDSIRSAYRSNYDRLVAIKTKYDPKNLFRVNQNIKPET